MEIDQSVVPEPDINDSLRDEKKDNIKRSRRANRKSFEKNDTKAKLERSRQSARECRARKKLRYQYLEELVCDREKAVLALRKELDMILVSRIGCWTYSRWITNYFR